MAYAVALPDTPHPVGIGISGGSRNGRFDGSLDEVAVYTRALTAAEVSERYDSR